MDIFNIDSYTSQTLAKHISDLKGTYNFLQVSNIGISNLGIPIPVIRFGRGPKEILYVGSTHANVFITTPLLMLFLEVLLLLVLFLVLLLLGVLFPEVLFLLLLLPVFAILHFSDIFSKQKYLSWLN